MTSANNERKGPGFALFGLATGAAAGLAGYAVVELWADRAADERGPLTVFAFLAAFTAAFLLLAERKRIAWAAAPALAIAGVLAIPTWFMLGAAAPEANLNEFPVRFWFLIGAPLAAYVMTTLAKAALEEGVPPGYSTVFFHGLTLPLIYAGASLFAVLAILLLFAWAALLRAMNVDFFHNIFQEAWFILPFSGAVGGAAIAMMRGLESVLGALRFILLLFCRIAMPITAVFSLTFLLVLATNGPAPIFEKPYPAAIMLALAFAGMLIFNGVYQNGEGGPPPLWLRVSSIAALIAFPVYAGLAAYALWLRIDDYGLTPPRVIGLAASGLAAAYSLVCLAGLITEARWRGERWMPLVGQFNVVMAGAWALVLILLATPLLDPWAMSAKSQETLLRQSRISPEEFDFGYLRFKLGAHGTRVLERLAAIEDHPEAALIRRGAEKALRAENRWAYENDGRAPTPAPRDRADRPGPPTDVEDLPLNPAEPGERDARPESEASHP
ncbi:DUF4153 domain-containing protein [Amphiplicatus metriothermophilus]|uniref:DUF4153 domain-containing protein n=1 Tax=Amphiplicatus metriothermophilus TaxID=1519374 RepID=A0A239PRY8_9PROT|nr:DUF4153 domain-containing protein [Amphiplicatus metriothermophilus]MBB5518354.1 hypothetical protein [Amphiplicatus metriothermophilus]SNT72477.1 protein of unknown function [Amphiplicatus metriothermophilus]